MSKYQPVKEIRRKRSQVCDSCCDSAYDDGVEADLQSTVMREFGGEMSDHLCDEVESNGDIKCGCGCRFR